MVIGAGLAGAQCACCRCSAVVMSEGLLWEAAAVRQNGLCIPAKCRCSTRGLPAVGTACGREEACAGHWHADS